MLDFIEGLFKLEGWDTILVVGNRLSKYAHFVRLKRPFTTVMVVDVFIKEMMKLDKVPQSIILNQGCVFMSHVWNELINLKGTNLNYSTRYHSQTDTQTEVVLGIRISEG